MSVTKASEWSAKPVPKPAGQYRLRVELVAHPDLLASAPDTPLARWMDDTNWQAVRAEASQNVTILTKIYTQAET